MKQGHEELLRALLRHDSATRSTDLAKEIGRSPRSIKSYVKQINESAGDLVIFSSKDGYLLNRKIALTLLDQQEGSPVPQSASERSSYIVKRFIVDHEESLDLFDLCEELYVSFSTLRSDIRRMNLSYERLGISFKTQNNRLSMAGPEKSKRRLIGQCLLEEAGTGAIGIAALKESYSALDVDSVTNALDETMRLSNRRINEISRNNLIMHLLILVDRVRNGDVLPHDSESPERLAEKDPVAEELCRRLSSDFSIEFGLDELLGIQMLLMAYTNAVASPDYAQLERIVGKELVQDARDLAEAISEQYDVNLATQSFLMPFCLHLKNLIERNQKGVFARNSLAKTVREECPLTYDIGTSLSIRLANKYGLTLSEDEIAFVALHVGAELERQRLDDTKVKGALLCPDYHGMAGALLEQLELAHSATLDIVACVPDENGLTGVAYDLLITTVPVNEASHPRVVNIPPFSRGGFPDISDAILSVRQDKELQALEARFDDYFSETLFFPQVEGMSREEIIKLLCSRLQELGYVDEFFDKDVLQREHASNTAFGAIAIPHAASMSANKTCISVATSTEGITWGSAAVRLVLLFAISDVDKGAFRTLYEAMIGLLSEGEATDLLSRATSFDEFRHAVMRSTGRSR